jgi:hypothetical protein
VLGTIFTVVGALILTGLYFYEASWLFAAATRRTSLGILWISLTIGPTVVLWFTLFKWSSIKAFALGVGMTILSPLTWLLFALSSH